MRWCWASLLLAAGCASEILPAPALPSNPQVLDPSTCPAGTKAMQGQCVTVRVAPRLSCGGAGRQVGKTCQYDVPPMAMAPEQPSPQPQAEEQQGGEPSGVLDLLPDDRPLRSQPSARPQLVTMAQNMERLIAQTAVTAPERAGYLAQLGEHYAELAVRGEVDAREAARRGDRAAEGHGKLIATASRRQAVKLLRQLLREHASYEKADEVRYYLAIELGLQGDKGGMAAALRELVEKHPESDYAERAREALQP